MITAATTFIVFIVSPIFHASGEHSTRVQSIKLHNQWYLIIYVTKVSYSTDLTDNQCKLLKKSSIRKREAGNTHFGNLT